MFQLGVSPTVVQSTTVKKKVAELAVRTFSTEVYTSTLKCCSGQKRSTIGRRYMRHTTTAT